MNNLLEEMKRRELLMQADATVAHYRTEFQTALEDAMKWIGLITSAAQIVVHHKHEGEVSDRSSSRFSEVDIDRMARLCIELHRYAWFGLRPRIAKVSGKPVNWDNPSEALVTLKLLINAAARRVRASAATQSSFPQSKRMIVVAEGRLHLDQRQSISVDELAALAGVSRKTIHNLCLPSATTRRLTQHGDGGISHASAQQWLSGRQDFLPSLGGAID